ncbi:MAG: YggT family protein [FCB group bacterium]|jgi:YggT family protein|nr:YggT family protein [FCB group bacterium]
MILAQNLVYSLLTLYMMLILTRWLGGWLGLEVEFGRLRWIHKSTEPLINFLRKRLPHMGPVDFGPIAALLLVWLVRVIVTQR